MTGVKGSLVRLAWKSNQGMEGCGGQMLAAGACETHLILLLPLPGGDGQEENPLI